MYVEGPDRAALEVDVLKLYSVNDDDAGNDDGCTIGTDAAASIVRPCAEGMLRLWRSLVVPILTIDICSEEVKVSLLLASVLATPSTNWMEKPGHTGIRAEFNPSQLLRYLILEIGDAYKASDEGRIFIDGYGTICTDVVRHKKPLIDLETGRLHTRKVKDLIGQTVQATANADRPGFVIDKYKEGSEEGVEVMELNCTMRWGGHTSTTYRIPCWHAVTPLL